MQTAKNLESLQPNMNYNPPMDLFTLLALLIIARAWDKWNATYKL